MNRYSIGLATATLLAAQISASAFAEVTPQEAAQLKTTLTPVGAERAANKDGTIPGWTGGYTTPLPGYKSGLARPDPFAGEKPLVSITADNVSKYADHLTEGQLLMFKKHPRFRMDVYPTHRTASFPDPVVANTFANATRARTTNGGLTLEGAFAGIPFPIPKTGIEAMWNHLLAWNGQSYSVRFSAYVVASDGKKILASQNEEQNLFPYYDFSSSVDKFEGDYRMLRNKTLEPPFKAGEMLLTREPVDTVAKGRQAWQYLTGQRRVRKAPSIAYDTPNYVMSGIGNYDEVNVFNGSMDRYDWRLDGKKEIYIPYNSNGIALTNIDDLVAAEFLNPEHVRWELHRVWVVDAALAAGKRHSIPHRRFFLDEDTWQIAIADEWDAQSQLWKELLNFFYVAPDIPGVFASFTYAMYDFVNDRYAVDNLLNGSSDQYNVTSHWSDAFFTPDALAADGVR